MKEHVQDYGVRKWAGDDLIELQSEPLSALQALVAPYAPCILQGCELETVPDGNGDGRPSYRLHAGYVALKGRKTVENGAGTGTDGTDTGSDGAETAAAEEYVKIVRVEAQTVHQPTVFLTLACTPVSRAYGNGENKAIAYDYTAEVCDVLSDVGDRPYLALAADADNQRLLDTLGVTRKLNREGGEAKDVVVNFAEVTAETDSVPNRPELKSGSSLGLLMRQIRKWFDELKDLKALAFKAKVAKVDLTEEFAQELAEELDGKALSVHSHDEATASSEGFMSAKDKEKLDGIKPNANYFTYTLPPASSDTRGGVKIGYSQSGRNYPVQLSDEKMYVHVPWTDTEYSHPGYTSRSSGLYKIKVDSQGHVSDVTAVTKADITALGIPGQDTNTTYKNASTTAAGLMPASDKAKLEGFVNGFRVTVNSLGNLRLIWKDTASFGSPEVYVDLSGKSL